MPESSEFLPLEGEKVQVLCYAWLACQSLRWEPEFANDHTINATAPAVWPARQRKITIRMGADRLEVISENFPDEASDAGSRNQKNLYDFRNAFRQTKLTASAEALAAVRERLPEIKVFTTSPENDATPEEIAAPAETGYSFHNYGRRIYATYTLMGINIFLFVLTLLDGADFFWPDGDVALRWGSNYAPLTLNGEWWRLFTSLFLHFGILPIVLNMYCLYVAGRYLEPLLGRLRFVTVFLCSGILGELFSLWWHQGEARINAGTATGLFGLYGLFVALLTTKLIRADIRSRLLQSCLVFIAINLLIGLRPYADNAINIGGLLSGFGFGYVWYVAMQEEEKGRSATWIAALMILFSAAAVKGFLLTHKGVGYIPPGVASQPSSSPANSSGSTEAGKFRQAMESFEQFDTKGIQTLNDQTEDDLQHATDLGSIARVEWESALEQAQEMEKYKVGPDQHKLATMLEEYARLRLDQIVAVADDLRAKRDGSTRAADLSRQIADMQKLIIQQKNKLPN